MIGIYGLGRFGLFIATSLAKKTDVVVSDKKNLANLSKRHGLTWVSPDVVCKQDILILAVPMQELKSVVQEIKPSLRKDQIVMDVCSLKVFAQKLLETLPCQTLATHPLFGPHSVKHGLKNQQVALCKTKHTTQNTLTTVKNMYQSLGLKTIVCTAKEHDTIMAQTQALSHTIGRALVCMKLTSTKMDTGTFKQLLGLVEMTSHDSPILYKNMIAMNPQAKLQIKKMMSCIKQVSGVR
jgi:prephenate dehydrogenase